MFTGVNDFSRALVLSNEGIISIAWVFESIFSGGFIVIPTGTKTSNGGKVEKGESDHTIKQLEDVGRNLLEVHRCEQHRGIVHKTYLRKMDKVIDPLFFPHGSFL